MNHDHKAVQTAEDGTFRLYDWDVIGGGACGASVQRASAVAALTETLRGLTEPAEGRVREVRADSFGDLHAIKTIGRASTDGRAVTWLES